MDKILLIILIIVNITLSIGVHYAEKEKRAHMYDGQGAHLK